MRKALGLLLVSAAMGSWLRVPHAAAADQAVDEGTRAAARQVMQEGLSAYQAGQYEQALEKFERAWSVMKIPTVALHRARATAKVGKLVEAAEQYLQVSQLEVSGYGRLQEDAKAAAPREREELLKRIPRIEFRLSGAAAEEILLTVDQQRVSAALVTVPRLVNPGQHRVRAERRAEVVTQEVTLKEGDTATLELVFSAGSAGPLAQPGGHADVHPSPTASSGATPRHQPAPSPVANTDPGKPRRSLGWIGIGIGGAGVLVGSLTGLFALSKKADLDADTVNCRDGKCGPEADVSPYNSLRIVSSAGFIIGAAGLGSGLVLILTAPRASAAGKGRFAPWIGVMSAGIKGQF